MKFLELELEGFKSFVSRQTINFDRPPGLYFMFGKNEIEPTLGSNAAGKSTIWDAVCWVIHGKTVKGQRAGDVVSWTKKKEITCGVLTIEDDQGAQRKIERRLQPNKLMLDGKVVEQSAIAEVVKLPYEPFLHSVIFGQKNLKFFDYKPADALRLFTEIFQLDEWLKHSESATASSNQFEMQKQELLQFESRALGRLEQAQIFLKNNTEDMKLWEEENADKVQRVKTKLSDLKEQGVELNKTKKHLIEHLDSLKDKIDSARGELNTVKNDSDKLDDELAGVNKKIGEAIGKQNAAKDNYSEFHRFVSAGVKNKCGVCLQPISQGTFEKRKLKLKGTWKEASKPVAKLTKDREKLSDKISKISLTFNRLQRDLRDHEINRGTTESEERQNSREIRYLQEEKRMLKDSLKDTEVLKNPHRGRVEETEIKCQGYGRSLRLFKRQIDYMEKGKSFAKFWTGGFKEIRLLLLSEFLTQYEIEANNCLSFLGMDDWRISFEVESETKAKTIKKGFTTTIYSPYNSTKAPWESWSGGESQRLLLSGSIGLANLIFNRYQTFSNIEVWDEPSNWLSEEGIEHLLSMLKHYALRTGKQVWVVDQRYLETGNFDGVLTVRKGKNGSYVGEGVE